ncbi:MAG: nucleotidyltransferase domain-containing protein [Candidatus Coatesbacteria bacterium]|nr:nucleotidyltransferase domain-containing protein [Candidatus Coatesbacteria bacterium]
MIEITDGVPAEIAGAIAAKIDPVLIILFGSHASGDVGPESDLDLLTAEREPFGQKRSRRKEISIVRELLSGFRVAEDILVYSEEEFSKWRGSVNHVIGRSVRTGRVLYERP